MSRQIDEFLCQAENPIQLLPLLRVHFNFELFERMKTRRRAKRASDYGFEMMSGENDTKLTKH